MSKMDDSRRYRLLLAVLIITTITALVLRLWSAVLLGMFLLVFLGLPGSFFPKYVPSPRRYRVMFGYLIVAQVLVLSLRGGRSVALLGFAVAGLYWVWLWFYGMKERS